MYKRTVWIVWCVHVIISQIRNNDRVRQKLDCSSNMSSSALEASTRQILLAEPTNWPWLTAPQNFFSSICCPRYRLNNTWPHGWPGWFPFSMFWINSRILWGYWIRGESFQFTKSIIHLVWNDVTSLFLEQKAKLSNLAENRRASKLLPISS